MALARAAPSSSVAPCVSHYYASRRLAPLDCGICRAITSRGSSLLEDISSRRWKEKQKRSAENFSRAAWEGEGRIRVR